MEIPEQTIIEPYILRNVPAHIHIFEVDKKYRFSSFWQNKKEDAIFKVNPEAQAGFTDCDSYFNNLDSVDIRDGVQSIIENAAEEKSIVCRLNQKYGDKWVYMRLKKISIKKEKNHLVAIIFFIDEEFASNQIKLNEYLREINFLKNQLRISLLTKTEIKILKLLGQGYTNKEIALQLHRSFNTINNHRRAIFRKLEIKRICELENFARENGLV